MHIFCFYLDSWTGGNNQFGGQGTASFSRTNNNNNFGAPTTQAFNNQNFGGPTTAPYFAPQSNNGGAAFGAGGAGASGGVFGGAAASAFGAAAGMMNPFADRLVTGPGIPRTYYVFSNFFLKIERKQIQYSLCFFKFLEMTRLKSF